MGFVYTDRNGRRRTRTHGLVGFVLVWLVLWAAIEGLLFLGHLMFLAAFR